MSPQTSKKTSGPDIKQAPRQKALAQTLELYIKDGIPPGGFLAAVIANDLKLAVERADDYEKTNFFAILAYAYNRLPLASSGSYQAIREWVAEHARRRARRSEPRLCSSCGRSDAIEGKSLCKPCDDYLRASSSVRSW